MIWNIEKRNGSFVVKKYGVFLNYNWLLKKVMWVCIECVDCRRIFLKVVNRGICVGGWMYYVFLLFFIFFV